MTLIDGDRIITAQLYDDEYEEFKEEKMSIIDYVNIYTNEGVTTADDVIDNIRAEIQENINYNKKMNYQGIVAGLLLTLDIIDKYRNEVME